MNEKLVKLKESIDANISRRLKISEDIFRILTKSTGCSINDVQALDDQNIKGLFGLTGQWVVDIKFAHDKVVGILISNYTPTIEKRTDIADIKFNYFKTNVSSMTMQSDFKDVHMMYCIAQMINYVLIEMQDLYAEAEFINAKKDEDVE